MQSLTQPEILLKPFAESGDKNSIPSTNTDAQNPQLADLTNGFPPITSEDPSDGGLPPERKDFNALGYLTTTYDYFYQAGGTFTFSPTISSAIGGYPLGARLWYTDGNGSTTILRSTIGNNTDNFNDGQGTGVGATWVPEIPALGWNNVWTGDNIFSGNVSVNGVLNSGTAIISSATISSSLEMNGAVSGGFLARSTINGWGIPNYKGGISISNNYTAPTNGYVYVARGGGSSATYLYINGVEVDANTSNQTNEGGGMVAFVRKDDVITWTTGNIRVSKFFPLFGENATNAINLFTENRAGNYTLNINDTGLYEVYVVGGGGGSAANSSGGGGTYVNGTVQPISGG